MTDARIAVRWTPRGAPLAARAVVGAGPAARALGRRLLDLGDDRFGELAAVASDDVLVVLGEQAALPWIDGVTYLGRDESAPELLLPTALSPTVPPAVLGAAIRARMPHTAQVAVLAAPARLIDCGAARAIDRDRLRAWLDAP